jgi:ferrochelatase
MQTATIAYSRTRQTEPEAAERTGRVAVVLMNLGTPDNPSPEAVRAYLNEFLRDPEVISLPRGMKWATPILARLIALFRAKTSAANYASIWTDRGSPLLVISQDQAAALENELGESFRVFVAMRYGNPSLASTLQTIESDGIQEVVFLPMYPHFAGATIGTALASAYQMLARKGLRWTVHVVSSWHDFDPYLEAQASLINRYLKRNHLRPSDTVLLFSAHSLPVSYIQAGDPYEKEITASIAALSERVDWPSNRIQTSFQSRLGPVEWLGPSTEHMLRELASKGERNAAICPVSFTADCVETYQELGIEYRAIFEKLGGKLWLIPALNDDPEFIAALKALVSKTLGGVL